MASRVSQVVVEVLRTARPEDTKARVTEVVVEVLRTVATYTPPAEQPRRVVWTTS